MKIVAGTPALVSGASSGIGRAVAVALAGRGARVALVARRREALGEVAEEVRAAGGEAVVVPVDLASEEGCREAVERAVEALGGLRLLVPNAGLGRYARVEEQPAEHAEVTVRINYLGTVHLVRHALPHLLAAAPSAIVAVTSSAGVIPHPMGSAYCASKAAANQYLAALRLEVADRGVAVSAVCPGPVRTPFFEEAQMDPERDLPRLARLLVPMLVPEDVARSVLRAARSGRPVTVIPAAMRFFTFSYRLAPRLSEWLMRRTG